MSAGIRVTHKTDQADLDKLKGTRVLQITTPSRKYFGFEIHNFDNTLTSINKIKGDKLEIVLDGVDDSLVLYSAVISYELTGLAAIANFGKE